MSSPISIRLHESTIERLERRAKHLAIPPRTLAQRYVEEGLRMDAHPLIHFVDGPGGRRAVLSRGPDVWEAIIVIRGNDNDVGAAAAYLEKPVAHMQAAVTYYGAFPEEIDELIAANERAAAEGYAEWLAGQTALAKK